MERRVNNFLEKHKGPHELYKGMGMTECLAAAFFSCDGANYESSVGIPLPMNIYKIVKPGTTEEVPYGTNGEICINGSTVMRGYYENEEETNATLKIHEDGRTWLHSGDVGYMTEEGILYFTQRIKRIIISSGYNIYPNMIENVIQKHEAVEACAVVGVPHPYKVNVPKVFLTVKQGTKSSDVVLEELKTLCREKLSRYAVPKLFEVREELPKTKFYKIDYLKLEQEEIEKYYKNIG